MTAWMVDQRHYLDVLDPLESDRIPAPARRIAAFFGSIVEGVTAGWDDASLGCPVTTRCIGKVGRRRCTDRVIASVLSDESIEWVCLTCGESGIIHHWQETPWNLKGDNQLFPALGGFVDLEMSFAEYEAVVAISTLDAPARHVLAAGRVFEADLVTVQAPRAWIKHLVKLITFEAKRTRSKKRAALYNTVLGRTNEAL